MSQLEEITRFRDEIDGFKGVMDASKESAKKFEKLSNMIDLDLSILVNSESKLSAINLLISDLRQTESPKLKRRLNNGIKDLIKIKDKLKSHLDTLEREQLTIQRRDIYNNFRNHIFRNVVIQSAASKDLDDLEGAIKLLSEGELYCSNDDQKGLIYYNKACYYSLLNQLGSAAKYLALAVETTPGYRESAQTDSDLDNLRDNDTMMNKAISGEE